MAEHTLPVCLRKPGRADQQRHLRLLEEVLTLPAAPFVEGHVLDYVRRFAQVRNLHCRADRFGNLLLAGSRVLPKRPVVFVAHADHPGFVARRMRGRGRLLADWHGGVEKEYFVGTRVRFHPSLDMNVVGTVRRIVDIEKDGSRERVRRVLLDVATDVPQASPGTWDVPVFKVKGRTIRGARIDDLAGLAAALSAFDLLAKHGLRHRAALLVTRAEEAGLIGASAAAFARWLPAESAVISIECSQAQVESPQQAGPIVRVGDRSSLFDPDLGDWLCHAAGQIANVDSTFCWQRRLMPGGTCEASVFRAAGYRTAGLCIALGNYHNRNTKRRKIEAETIDRQDWLGLVRLIAGAAMATPTTDTAKPLARQFQRLLRSYRLLLKDPLARPVRSV